MLNKMSAPDTMYQITAYTRRQAKRLGVSVKHSTVKGKKLDVFKNGSKVASIGALGYKDYPTFLKQDGTTVANQKRVNYKKRHEKDRHRVGTPGYYADQLLW